MVNYQNGKIYKIVGNGQTYYGSTCEKTCAMRMTYHRKSYKRYKKGKCRFVTSFPLLDDESCYILLIELYPCGSKDELHARERSYIENNECVNKVIPGRTKKEWRIDNKEKIREYRVNNKDKINQKHDCECGGKFTYAHKAKHFKTKKHQRYLQSI